MVIFFLNEATDNFQEKGFFVFVKILFIYFLHREEWKEKEKERNINVWLPLAHPQLGTWPATKACTLAGNRTGDPLVSRLALNPLSHTSQCSRKVFIKRDGNKVS